MSEENLPKDYNTIKRYSFEKYTHKGILRISFWHWIIFIFLSRHVLATVILGAAHGSGKGGGQIIADTHLGGLIQPWFLIADIPALLLLIAASNRVEKAGKAVRWVWAKGQFFILASVSIYFLLFGLLVFTENFRPAFIDFLLVLLNLFILYYIFKDKYVKDMFADFPNKL
jgi:Protein of unknown function (DUF2919)